MRIFALKIKATSLVRHFGGNFKLQAKVLDQLRQEFFGVRAGFSHMDLNREARPNIGPASFAVMKF